MRNPSRRLRNADDDDDDDDDNDNDDEDKDDGDDDGNGNDNDDDDKDDDDDDNNRILDEQPVARPSHVGSWRSSPLYPKLRFWSGVI